MARKKEAGLAAKNRSHIIKAAKNLFAEQGIEKSSMDDVAKAAAMSKSTIYVYFKSKEEIFNCIALEAMQALRQQLAEVAGNQDITEKQRHGSICQAFCRFKEEYPLYFETLAAPIAVSECAMEKQPVLRDIYQTGEEINALIGNSILEMFPGGDKKMIMQAVFMQWGSLYGILTLADSKEEYIRKELKCTREEFLQQSFEMLFHALPVDGRNKTNQS